VSRLLGSFVAVKEMGAAAPTTDRPGSIEAMSVSPTIVRSKRVRDEKSSVSNSDVESHPLRGKKYLGLGLLIPILISQALLFCRISQTVFPPKSGGKNQIDRSRKTAM